MLIVGEYIQGSFNKNSLVIKRRYIKGILNSPGSRFEKVRNVLRIILNY